MSSFTRPTLEQIVTRVGQDFVSRMELTGAVLRRSVVHIMSRVIAGASHMLHGHIAWGVDQLFPDTSELAYLQRWGKILGITLNPAAAATGTLTLTGTNGSVVASGSALQRSDGVAYTTTADATIASGTATVPVTASLAALDGDCDAGVVLTFLSPVAGVDAQATVVSLSGGADVETTEDYRVRIIARFQDPPNGGSEADYQAWAKEVPGVTRVWVIPRGLGVGTVLIYFVRDLDVVQIPDSGEVATVQAHINAVKPVTAAPTVAAPVADPLDLTVHLDPDTSVIRTAVQAELADLLTREAEPGATLLLAHIRQAIGNAAGDGNYSLYSPSADVAHATGHIPTPGTVTYV